MSETEEERERERERELTKQVGGLARSSMSSSLQAVLVRASTCRLVRLFNIEPAWQAGVEVGASVSLDRKIV